MDDVDALIAACPRDFGTRSEHAHTAVIDAVRGMPPIR
jgi:hypothetical protein